MVGAAAPGAVFPLAACGVWFPWRLRAPFACSNPSWATALWVYPWQSRQNSRTEDAAMTIPSPSGSPARPRIDPVIRIWSGLVGAVLLVWWLAFVTFSLFHFLVAWGRPSNIFFMVLEFVTPLAAGCYLLLAAVSGRWDTGASAH